MKIISKKCPNFGASLSVSDGDKKITCEYCKQEMLVEKDNLSSDEIQLHIVKSGIKIFNSVLFFILLVGIIVMLMFTLIFFKILNFGKETISSIDNEAIDFPVEMPEDKSIKDLSEITKAQLEEIHKASLNKLEEQPILSISDIKSPEWKYYGTYFLKHKNLDTNQLHDVFTATYIVNGKNISVYASVMYSNLELIDNDVISNIPGFVRVPTGCAYGDRNNCILGYENVEKLYDDLIRNKKGDYTISATEGVYLK